MKNQPAENQPRTAAEITAEIIRFFEDNTAIFNDCIEELDRRTGYLGDNRYIDMDELNEMWDFLEPTEILCRADFGYDADTYVVDMNHCRARQPFNPHRNYFKFNAHGHPISTNYKDYSAQLDERVVKTLAENRDKISAIVPGSTLALLFDELEAVEE